MLTQILNRFQSIYDQYIQLKYICQTITLCNRESMCRLKQNLKTNNEKCSICMNITTTLMSVCLYPEQGNVNVKQYSVDSMFILGRKIPYNLLFLLLNSNMQLDMYLHLLINGVTILGINYEPNFFHISILLQAKVALFFGLKTSSFYKT